MPAISVLIPAYINIPDKAIWLIECLDSIRRQTFEDWEAIIIDDASPIPIQQNNNLDSRFRWFKASHNQGPARCRNTAVSLAESEAIIALDADDQFGTEATLERLYEVWRQDKSRIVYGNLQRLILDSDRWVREKTIVMGEYSWENVQNVGGLFPVTALHSVNAHLAAGGWKPELEAGLEDVEYWLSCAEHDFPGIHINHTTLLYRRHQDSRAFYLRQAGKQREMEIKIMVMHKDTYEGKSPMGCKSCGSKQSGNGVVNFQQQARITTLDDVPDNEKVWVEYVGPKSARFSIMVVGKRDPYVIFGTGHKFEVHIRHLQKFKELNRGRDFLVGIPAPMGSEPIRMTETILPPSPQPQLARIERLDKVAMMTRQVEPETSINIPLPIAITPIVAPKPIAIESPLPISSTATYDLSFLGLSRQIQDMLQAESWTIEKLARSKPENLTPYKGIGLKRAQAIIDSAKGLV
jgi:hypothetical protein